MQWEFYQVQHFDTPNGDLVGHRPLETAIAAITNEHDEKDLLVDEDGRCPQPYLWHQSLERTE
jgi:hypothetical protein